jgi:nucleoside-diphosphate-sugar epimerase
VTGGSGFVGRRLCERLSRAGDVRVLCRGDSPGPWSGLDSIDLACDDLPAGLLDGFDTVVHLAARTHAVDEHGDTELLYRELNVEGTRKLLAAAASSGVRRFVLMSSVKAMGESTADAADESSPAEPTTWYGRTKLAAEQLVLHGGYVPEPVVLRSTLVYGPGVHGNLERMIRAIRTRRFPPVPETGNKRSLVHVDDLVSAALLAAESPAAAGRVFIVTDGRPVSTRQMYQWISDGLGVPAAGRTIPVFLFRALALGGDAIGRIRGRRFVFDSAAHKKLFGSAWYDSTAIETALGYKPQWTFREAIPQMTDGEGVAG